MPSESTIAITAVIVSGVVGILGVGGGLAGSLIVSHRAHQDQLLQAREELRQTDRDELRRVLDRAALGLSRSFTRADKARSDVLYEPHAFLGDERSFDAGLAELPASEASLSTRLGSASRARATYRRAMNALGEVSQVLRAIRQDWTDNPRARHPTDDELEIVEQNGKVFRSAGSTQTQFLREAYAIGRSIVDPIGSGSP